MEYHKKALKCHGFIRAHPPGKGHARITFMASAKSKGHSEHTKSADNTLGLPGVMPRPIKITMMGAGSGFTPRLMNDVIRIPGNNGGLIALVDIDRERLRTMHKLIEKLIAQIGVKGWTVVSSADRRKVLPGSDYVV